MFRPLGLLSDVPCPEHAQCHPANCIFSHDVRLPVHTPPGRFRQTQLASEPSHESKEGPRKRRRIADDSNILSNNTHDPPYVTPPHQWKAPEKASRSISPPPLRRDASTVKAATKADTGSIITGSQSTPQKPVSLNPRMLLNAPAPHAKRMQIIRMMFEHMDRLNQQLCGSVDSSDQAVTLSQDGLVLQTLEEEETAATKNPSIYENIVKMRIMRLKKMSVSEWKLERSKQLAAKKESQSTTEASSSVDTGLNPSQEISFLSKLLARQTGLEKYGYVTMKPPIRDVEQARKGLEAARGWEECDRCKSRFQVFNGRRSEDGALTSGGTCTYHPARARKPLAIDKADKTPKEPNYACCKENVGVSAGCTIATTHVFKVTSPARLELLVPFEETPENPIVSSQSNAVCFDCEMGYTTCGLEMIRITATSFPNRNTILDTLVRPEGEILDLNSRYSGVWPEDFANAVPYDASMLLRAEDKGRVLPIADSPAAARKLLFSFLSPSTPLIGHALDNDLNVARIIHPAIVDTVLLFPHPRGLPIRFGLKMLTKKYLNRNIQMGDGSQGHDSKEDAIAAGELVRYKIQEAWAKMSREGWTVESTDFAPPKSRADTMRDDIRKLN